MENCLVTKLKATVNNDNLPKLGVMSLYLKELSDNPSDRFITIGAKGGSITISCTDGFSTTAQGTLIYSYTLQDRTSVGLYLANVLNNTVEIEGVYNVGVLTMSDAGKVQLSKGKESLAFANVGVIRARGNVIDVTNFKGLLFQETDTPITELNKFIQNNPDLKHGYFAAEYSEIQSLTQIQDNLSLYGNMADIPLSIRRVALANPLNTGSIEAFVAARVAGGQTTGEVLFLYANSTNGVTYNGESLKSYCQTHSISNAYISWNGTSIVVSATSSGQYVAPESMNTIISEYLLSN